MKALLILLVLTQDRRVPLEYKYEKNQELKYLHELHLKTSAGDELKLKAWCRYVVTDLLENTRYAAHMKVFVDKVEADKTYEPKDLWFKLEAGYHG